MFCTFCRIGCAFSCRRALGWISPAASGGVVVARTIRCRQLGFEVVPESCVEVVEMWLQEYLEDIARTPQRNAIDGAHAPGPLADDHDLVGQRDRFDEIVRDEDDGILLFAPDLQQLVM